MKNIETRTFVTSDTHFNHSKILPLTNREFLDITQMNEKLISNWNKVVRPQDNVYILGDFILSYGGKSSFTNIVSRLNGHKFLVQGNHDRYSKHWLFNNGIDFVCDKLVTSFAGKNICMIHNPLNMHKIERGSYDILLHGHLHESTGCKLKKRNMNMYNVNTELHNFTPVRIESILKQYSESRSRRKEKERLKRLAAELNA